jgi:hypothetical protein
VAHQVVTPAYRTKLGNLPAKSILALLANDVNADGFGYPSIERMVRNTEVSRRTVFNVIRVFVKIGLIAKIDRGPRRCFGTQLALDKLGTDLRKEFKAAYTEVQKKGDQKCDQFFAKECRRDTVAETLESVAKTPKSVAETLPPNPLIGVPVIEPLLFHTPIPPEGGVVDDDLDAEQVAHLERCKDPERRKAWERVYREQNRQAAEERRKFEARRRQEIAEQAELESEIRDVATARAWIMRQCGFLDRGRRRGLVEILELVLAQEQEAGRPVRSTATELAKRWKKYQEVGADLVVRYGPARFFELGLWRNANTWHWDEKKLELRAAACAGMGR